MLSLQLLQTLLRGEEALLKLLLAPPQLFHPPLTLLQLGGEVSQLLRKCILLPNQSNKLKVGRERNGRKGEGEGGKEKGKEKGKEGEGKEGSGE